jgi:hypothetical protein
MWTISFVSTTVEIGDNLLLNRPAQAVESSVPDVLLGVRLASNGETDLDVFLQVLRDQGGLEDQTRLEDIESLLGTLDLVSDKDLLQYLQHVGHESLVLFLQDRLTISDHTSRIVIRRKTLTTKSF